MSTKKCLLVESVHPLDLINQVKKWPVLYEKNRSERANHNFRDKIWHQVAKSLLNDWEALTPQQRQNTVSDIIKKWRNLRDTFKRQLHVDKKIREGHNIKKKVYVYYEHMKFLKDHVAGDETEVPALRRAPRRPRSSRPARSARPPSPARSSVFIQDIDEDEHFLLSLIPSFKKMTEEDKFTVKMEILKSVRAVLRCGSEDLPAPDAFAASTSSAATDTHSLPAGSTDSADSTATHSATIKHELYFKQEFLPQHSEPD